MTIKNQDTGLFSNWLQCHTGAPAPNLWAITAARAQLYLRCYHAGSGYVASYIGRPDHSVNGDADSGTTAEFHIITGFPVREDSEDRRLIVLAQLWKMGFDDGGAPAGPVREAWRFYADHTDGGGSEAWTKDLGYTYFSGVTTDDDYSSGYPNGPLRIFEAWVAPVATTTDDGFRMSRLEADYATVAVLNVVPVPSAENVSHEMALVSAGDVAVGEPICGYDTGAAADRSLGFLARRIDSGDSCVHETRRCLFQTCYPLGAYGEGSTSDTHFRRENISGSGVGMSYKVNPRNLDGGSGDIHCQPAICLTATAGTVIKMNSLSAGDTWVYTVPGGGVSKALITPSDGANAGANPWLDIAPGGDYITITHDTDVGGTAALHTASLWEPTSRR